MSGFYWHGPCYSLIAEKYGGCRSLTSFPSTCSGTYHGVMVPGLSEQKRNHKDVGSLGRVCTWLWTSEEASEETGIHSSLCSGIFNVVFFAVKIQRLMQNSKHLYINSWLIFQLTCSLTGIPNFFIALFGLPRIAI